ncbi:MAG: NTP transferase domain-containing protein [Bacteroidetes bacterium]|uniref:NTP transferase domain-containing protein n=1 Tax=Candidatus Cryptobacteroides merdavium TaxID=2840769 RepID=A0A9D9EBP0_9BACT|nr:NTP transferase domain-containing protein [Candidatus Cryptobacteroides merdavium]
MKAMIFAAGLGTRLKPLTDTMPKALVPVCGKPLLYHVLNRLAEAGFDDIVVNVHHFADKIEEYLASHGNFGLRISISDERDLLRETGGGIRHARRFLEDCPVPSADCRSGNEDRPLPSGTSDLPSGTSDRCFLVHNVDIISDLDLRWFVAQSRPDALATLLVSERKTNRYLLFDKGMRLAGWTNVTTGEVRSPYPDLDVQSCRRLAFSGIHFISDRIFSVMDEEDSLAEESGQPPFGERFPIMDFYLRTAARYPIYGVEAKNLHLADVGKMQTLHDAEMLCSRLLAR